MDPILERERNAIKIINELRSTWKKRDRENDDNSKGDIDEKEDEEVERKKGESLRGRKRRKLSENSDYNSKNSDSNSENGPISDLGTENLDSGGIKTQKDHKNGHSDSNGCPYKLSGHNIIGQSDSNSKEGQLIGHNVTDSNGENGLISDQSDSNGISDHSDSNGHNIISDHSDSNGIPNHSDSNGQNITVKSNDKHSIIGKSGSIYSYSDHSYNNSYKNDPKFELFDSNGEKIDSSITQTESNLKRDSLVTQSISFGNSNGENDRIDSNGKILDSKTDSQSEKLKLNGVNPAEKSCQRINLNNIDVNSVKYTKVDPNSDVRLVKSIKCIKVDLKCDSEHKSDSRNESYKDADVSIRRSGSLGERENRIKKDSPYIRPSILKNMSNMRTFNANILSHKLKLNLALKSSPKEVKGRIQDDIKNVKSEKVVKSEEIKPELKSNKKKVRKIIDFFEKIETKESNVISVNLTEGNLAKKDNTDKVDVDSGRIASVVNAFDLLMRGGDAQKRTPGRNRSRKEKESPATGRKFERKRKK